jgi:single-stranded DNA-binding protein
MAILATQTIVGNIGRVYEAREVGEQKREVIDFTVAVTPRRLDRW